MAAFGMFGDFNKDVVRERLKRQIGGMEKPLRILHVVRQFDPGVGGLEVFVKSLARHHAALGHQVEVLTLNRLFEHGDEVLKPCEKVGGVSVRRVGFIGWRRFFVPFLPLGHLRHFDVVHVHAVDLFFDLLALLRVFYRWKLVATTHGGYFHTGEWAWVKKIYWRWVTRFTIKAYDVVFANNSGDLKRFAQLSDRVVLQPNAVEPLKVDLCCGRDLIYWGRLAPHKHVGRLIEVFARLKQQGVAVGRLHIVGPEAGVSVAELVELAQRFGVAGEVKFHGFLPPHKLASVLKMCGFFVSASAYEGFGMALIEAMSAGLIPLVEGNESFTELVEQAGVGRTVDYARPASAAAMMALEMAAVQPEMRRAARDFARRFDWETLAKQALAVYRNGL